jgi:IclR family acetate operon transcriptional repressor
MVLARPAPIQSLDRALAILDLIAEEGRSMAVGEIASQLELTVPTVSRLASTMRDRGLLAQEQYAGPYGLGLGLSRYAHRAVNVHPLEVAAASVTAGLVEDLGETVSLAIPSDHGVLYVRSQGPTDRMIHISIPVGQILPYAVTATGKVLLAFGDPDRLEAEIEAGLPSRTPDSITSPEDFRREIANVRAAGFAVERGESAPGVGCVAVPVFRSGTHATAALSTSATVTTLTEARIEEMRDRLLAGAEEISEAYGWGQSVRRRPRRRTSQFRKEP